MSDEYDDIDLSDPEEVDKFIDNVRGFQQKYRNDPSGESYVRDADRLIDITDQFVEVVPNKFIEKSPDPESEYNPEHVGALWPGAYKAVREMARLTGEASELLLGASTIENSTENVSDDLIRNLARTENRMDAARERYRIAYSSAITKDQFRLLEDEEDDVDLALDYAIEYAEEIGDDEMREFFESKREDLAETHEEHHREFTEMIEESLSEEGTE